MSNSIPTPAGSRSSTIGPITKRSVLVDVTPLTVLRKSVRGRPTLSPAPNGWHTANPAVASKRIGSFMLRFYGKLEGEPLPGSHGDHREDAERVFCSSSHLRVLRASAVKPQTRSVNDSPR